MDALVDPGIAEIVQHRRLVGIERQRLLEVGLGLRPLLGALIGDAAIVEEGPVGPRRLADHLDRLGEGLRRLGETLAALVDAAERDDGVEILRILGDDRLEVADGVVGTVELVERAAELDFRIALEGEAAGTFSKVSTACSGCLRSS